MSKRKPGEALAFPILFQPDMLRATLDGRKTMTRRIAQLVFDGETTGDGITTGGYEPDPTKGWGRVEVGDRLRVRETLYLVAGVGWTYALDGAHVQLAADDPHVPAMISWAHHKEGWVCVSIHMPMWACRHELIVTSKRAEHVQEISEADALAEGIVRDDLGVYLGAGNRCRSARSAFRFLWDEINLKRAPWASNPWVWAIGYELGEARRATG